MLEHTNAAPQRPASGEGDMTALAECLGRTEWADLAPAGVAGPLNQVRNPAELRLFLCDYATRVLAEVELPAILQAFRHASRGETRELVALDGRLRQSGGTDALARASEQVGRAQLRKLRPVRDQRFVQRYLTAVERGEARGWHTVVFGMVLALYAMPLRQGMMHYALHTLNGFIQSSAGPLRLRLTECEALLADVARTLPEAVERVLGADEHARCWAAGQVPAQP